MDKYEKIFLQIRDKINSGEYPEGSQIPTESELCQLFQVSRITASRAARELQHAGLVRRVAGQGTFVCRSVNAKQHPFYLILPTLRVRYYDLLADSFCGYLRDRGLIGCVVCSEYNMSYLQSLLPQLHEEICSGLAIVPPADMEKSRRLLPQLGSLKVPVAIASRKLAGFSGPQVATDEEAAGILAATHLLQQGRRRLLYVGPINETVSASIARFSGVQHAIRTIQPNATLQVLDCVSVETIFLPALTRIFTEDSVPDAVIAADEQLAAEIYDFLKAVRIPVGEKTSLIGMDGGLVGLALEVPLTTVEFPGREIGERTAEFLCAIAENKLPNADRGVHLVAPKLVIRETCGAPVKRYRHEYLREIIHEGQS